MTERCEAHAAILSPTGHCDLCDTTEETTMSRFQVLHDSQHNISVVVDTTTGKDRHVVIDGKLATMLADALNRQHATHCEIHGTPLDGKYCDNCQRETDAAVADHMDRWYAEQEMAQDLAEMRQLDRLSAEDNLLTDAAWSAWAS